MKKHRHRILGAVLFVLYLVLLTYFLFFAEEMGRSPDFSAGHLGADETLVYHSTLKLCHESSCGDDAACRQSRKL